MAVETIETTGFTRPNCRAAVLAAAEDVWGTDETHAIEVPYGRRAKLEAAISLCERDLLPTLGDQHATATYDLTIALDIDLTHEADESVAITLTAHPAA